MLREFFFAPARFDRVVAWCGLAVIIFHAIFSAYIKFAVNSWYNTFYDLLQEAGRLPLMSNATSNATGALPDPLAASRTKVWMQLLSFLRLVAPAAVVHPLSRWARSHWALRWRMCLMRTYIDGWDPNLPPIEGASQRLHEDTQRFAKGVDSYLAVLLNSVCTLTAFTPILISLGGRVPPPAALAALGTHWMLACALLAALIGLGVAMVAGRHLVSLEVANQRVEAELRRDAVVLEATPHAICAKASPAAHEPPEKAPASPPPTPRLSLLPPAPHFAPLWQAIGANYSSLYANFLGLNL